MNKTRIGWFDDNVMRRPIIVSKRVIKVFSVFLCYYILPVHGDTLSVLSFLWRLFCHDCHSTEDPSINSSLFMFLVQFALYKWSMYLWERQLTFSLHSVLNSYRSLSKTDENVGCFSDFAVSNSLFSARYDVHCRSSETSSTVDVCVCVKVV